MPLRIYNTLTNQKETFTPLTPGKVGIYLCGPTVYKPAHIGHAVGPIVFEAVKRYLTFRGLEVTWVVNITDVEDKLIAEAAERGCSSCELAERITDDYLDAMDKLDIRGIDHMPKASEHIDDIIRYVERLIDKNAAYVSGGDVYFDVSADDDYGKLSNRRSAEQSGQRQLQSAVKRHPGDFALWKAAKPDEPEEVKFASPWGPGRPGWHIECSVMSMKYLGESFDIHGGGLDLIFPHHENEIAQAETATGKPFASCWMHHGLTRFNTKKVSKSDPQMQQALQSMTLHSLLGKYSGELLRFFVLSTHYRRPIDFSTEELEGKRKGLESFYRLFERLERACGATAYGDPLPPDTSKGDGDGGFPAAIKADRQRFLDAMDDDFNTAGAIAVLFDMVTRINRFMDQRDLDASADQALGRTALAAGRQVVELGRLLNLFLRPPDKRYDAGGELTNRIMDILIEVRQRARQTQNFELSDYVRDALTEAGITLEDRRDGTVWRAD